MTAKPEVVDWLKRSLDAVKTAHANIKPADLQRRVRIANRDATVDAIYLRIHRSCKRAHGPVGGLCTHEWNCAALVREHEMRCLDCSLLNFHPQRLCDVLERMATG